MSSSCSGNCGSCSSAGSCSEKKEEANLLKGVREAILVLSGKGGVGKSTVAASVAVELAKSGKKVGLLDVDFHGPSQPTLFGIQYLRLEEGQKGFLPVEVAGVKLISVGLVLDDPDHAVIWRGPAKNGALKQLLEETEWGELDYLVLDFPPGTGDEALSGCQLLPMPKRALVVTTPQEVALLDVVRGIAMFRNEHVNVPIRGIVENMAWFTPAELPENKYYIFGPAGPEGRVAALAAEQGVPFLGSVPLVQAIAEGGDSGEPIASRDSVTGEAFRELARALAR